MKKVINVLFLGGIIFVALMWLQIYLSKKESKWYGLVLPLLSALISVMPLLGFSAYDNMPQPGSEGQNIVGLLLTMLWVLFIFNIPTIIYLAIYFATREKIKKEREIDQMKIKDL